MKLAKHLEDTYGWPVDEAIAFALSGYEPPVRSVRVRARRRATERALDRISLDVAPWVTPEEVADVYRTVRRDLGKWAPHPLGERRTGIIRFVNERFTPAPPKTRRPRQGPPGRVLPLPLPPWQQLVDEWDRLHPRWTFNGDRRRFAWEFKRAMSALLPKR
jgi:hypothetical protein